MASVDLGTLRRHHGLWVWLTTRARGLADPLGRFCDTMRVGCCRGRVFGRHLQRAGRITRDASAILCDGCVELSCHAGWLPRLGRFGDTIRRVGLGQLHSWDAPATPWSVGWLAFCTRVQVSAARDALRYHAVGVQVDRGQDRAGLPTVGTLRRYHPSGSVCLVAGWPQHIGEAVALLGRSGDAMVCGRTNVLHTGVGRYCSGRFAIPCGGPGSGRVAKGWDVSTTPNGTMVLDSGRSRCGVKGPLWSVRLPRSARVWVPGGSVL